MRLAVIQHRMLESAARDFESLAEMVDIACSQGAEVIVCPRVASIQDGPWVARPFLDRVGRCADGTALLVPFGWPHDGDDNPLIKVTPLGATVLLNGDDALDPDIALGLVAAQPDAIIMRPAPESPLQAEAFIERALALSMSVAGLVIIAETIGVDVDSPGFGGSCIASMGDLAAEAEMEDESEVMIVDLDVPMAVPEPREALASLPPILVQRWEHHHGRRAPVNYPAELS